MRRLRGAAMAAFLLLVLGAPAAMAADGASDQVLLSFNGGLDVPASQQVEAVIVFGGDATVAGQATTIVVVDGDLTLDGARADNVAVVNGTVRLEAGTIVSGDVRTLNGSVVQDPAATVGGSVKGLDAELATFGILLAPALLLFYLGFALVTILAVLVLAALAARQVRAAGELIGREPVPTLAFGIAGAIGLPILALVAMVTVIGAPLGLTLLLMVLPAASYVGWLVAAIWLGDWLLVRMRGSVEPERPYLAGVLGVLVLGLLGLFPPVTVIASLFGFGAVLLLAWKILRHEALPAGAPLPTGAPTHA